MAQNTRTWDSLIQLATARVGGGLNDDEVSMLSSLLNSAAHIMYNESPWWERFLVLEPRTVERGYVAYDEDSYNVYGAGTSEVNGLYVRNGTVNTKPAYRLYDTDGTTELYSIEWDGATDWQLLDASDAVIYDITDSSATPPSSGWASNTGEDLPPIVQELSEIGEYVGHWDGKKWSGCNPNRGTAYPDQNGIRITGQDQSIVYMAFKKSWTTVYGDGTSGTVSDVPSEWFEFMAYSGARSFIAAARQQEGYNPVALSEIERVREQALLKITRQGVYESIAQRFRTYYNQDVSVY